MARTHPPSPTGTRPTLDPGTARLRVSRLPRGGHAVALAPDAPARDALAARLDLVALEAAALIGRLDPDGPEGWALDARLTGRVVQPCVVTLEPVTTAIDEPVTRRWTPHAAQPDETEAEMPDDTIEPLGDSIDLGAVLEEALALALPLYPRAPGAALPGEGQGQGRGVGEGKADTRRPFAGLDALLAQRRP